MTQWRSTVCIPVTQRKRCTACITLEEVVGGSRFEKNWVARNNCGYKVKMFISFNIEGVLVTAPLGGLDPGATYAIALVGDQSQSGLFYAVPYEWTENAAEVDLPCAVPFKFESLA